MAATFRARSSSASTARVARANVRFWRCSSGLGPRASRAERVAPAQGSSSSPRASPNSSSSIRCACARKSLGSGRWLGIGFPSPATSSMPPSVRSHSGNLHPTGTGHRRPRRYARHVPRGDGRLTHDLDPQNPGPQDACGVFGVWAPGEEVAKLTYFGLYALQHRGQEAAGIAVSDGSSVVVYKDLGLVSQVFDEATLGSLRGHIAVGHTRSSTTGASTWENAQPTFRTTDAGTGLALCHNGNLVNTAELASKAADAGVAGVFSATTDSDVITALIAAHPDLSVEAAAMQVLPRLRGAFSFTFMDEDTLYAARDPQGVRPLVLGRLERGWVV